MIESQETPSAGSPPAIPPEIAAAAGLNASEAGAGELVPAPSQADLGSKAEFATNHASYISTYIGLADTKAAWVFAIPTAAIAYLSTQQEVWTLLTLPGRCGTKVLAVIAVVLLLLSAGAAFAVIVPRLAGASDGIVYFGAVARRKSASAYLADLAPLSEGALIDACLSHNFELARVCRRKYAALRIAMWSGLIALVTTVALIAILKLAAR